MEKDEKPLVEEQKLERFRELYYLSKEVLNEEQNRFNRANNGASLYLSVLTFLAGLGGIIGNWVVGSFIPPKTIFDYLNVLLVLTLFLFLAISWIFFFRAIKMSYVKKIPMNSKILDLFLYKNLPTAYYVMTKSISQALNINRQVTDRKLSHLNKGYQWAMRTGIVYGFVLLAFISSRWLNPKQSNNYQGSAIMLEKPQDDSEKKGSKNASEDEVDLNAESIEFDSLAEAVKVEPGKEDDSGKADTSDSVSENGSKSEEKK